MVKSEFGERKRDWQVLIHATNEEYSKQWCYSGEK